MTIYNVKSPEGLAVPEGIVILREVRGGGGGGCGRAERTSSRYADTSDRRET